MIGSGVETDVWRGLGVIFGSFALRDRPFGGVACPAGLLAYIQPGSLVGISLVDIAPYFRGHWWKWGCCVDVVCDFNPPTPRHPFGTVADPVGNPAYTKLGRYFGLT